MNQEILDRIDALAAKLGVVGEHLWAVLIRQVYIEAGLFMLSAGVAGALSVFLVRVWNRSPEYDRDVFLGIAITLSVVAFIFTLAGISGLANAEYHALEKILSKVG